MLIDGIAGLADRRYPVCIVGSGPVGLTMAVDLARRGIDVLVLESGGQAADAAAQELSQADIVDPARHDDMTIAVARRLGGTSHLWGGRCLPYDPIDFAPDRGFDNADLNWPIAYDAIAEYLPRAVAATASGAAVFHAETPLLPGADAAFDVDSLERWVNVQASDRLLHEEIRQNPRLHLRTHATLVGFGLAGDGRVTTAQVAHTASGERLEIPVDRLVLAAGGLETTRLLLAAARGRGDIYGSGDGPLGRYYMGHLIGEIADIALSSRRIARGLDFHVDRHGSYVRRRFVASPATQRAHRLLNAAFWPVVPPIADARHHSALLSLLYLTLSDERLGARLVAEAIRRRHVPADGSVAPAPHWRNLLTGLPAALAGGLSLLGRRYLSRHRLPGFFVLNKADHYGLAYHGEQLPRRDSRATLTSDADRLGLPRLRIDLRFSDEDANSLVRTHDLLDAWLRRNGVGELTYRMPTEDRAASILASAAHGTHQIGLTRMGRDRRDGVVDGDLRSFDSPNLFLASASVLRSSGQANPTLSTVALGLRLADELAAELG